MKENLRLVSNNTRAELNKPSKADDDKEIKAYVDGLFRDESVPKLIDDSYIAYDVKAQGRDLPIPEVMHLDDDTSLTENEKDLVANSVVKMAHAPHLRIVPKMTEISDVPQEDKDAQTEEK